MAEDRKRKVNHKSSILNIRTFHPQNLLPGMIITFIYNAPGIYDRNPLLFYFGEGTRQKEGSGKSRKNAPRESIKKSISGINFNYLMPIKVQKLFDWVSLWFESKKCKNFICTIKFQGTPNYSFARKFLEFEGGQVVHLYNNKHELTFIHKE